MRDDSDERGEEISASCCRGGTGRANKSSSSGRRRLPKAACNYGCCGTRAAARAIESVRRLDADLARQAAVVRSVQFNRCVPQVPCRVNAGRLVFEGGHAVRIVWWAADPGRCAGVDLGLETGRTANVDPVIGVSRSPRRTGRRVLDEQAPSSSGVEVARLEG